MNGFSFLGGSEEKKSRFFRGIRKYNIIMYSYYIRKL